MSLRVAKASHKCNTPRGEPYHHRLAKYYITQKVSRFGIVVNFIIIKYL